MRMGQMRMVRIVEFVFPSLHGHNPAHGSLLGHIGLMRMKHIAPLSRKPHFQNYSFGLAESNNIRVLVRSHSCSGAINVERLRMKMK